MLIKNLIELNVFKGAFLDFINAEIKNIFLIK